jgi:hypothetical protein
MATMVSASISSQARHIFPPACIARRRSAIGRCFMVSRSGSLRSAPIEKFSAVPVSTTADTVASFSKLRAAAVSWRRASADIGLARLPRSKRTTATRSWRSIVTMAGALMPHSS